MSRRRRNPRENHSGLGAFAGSVVGGIPGHIVRWAGAKNFGGLLVYMGWVAGGGIGAYYGAKDDRKRRAAIGGSIGGLFTPLGAAFGGYVAGLEPDSPKRNPAAWVIPAVAVGVLGAAGAGAYAYMRHRKAKSLSPSPNAMTIPESAWDSGKRVNVPKNTNVSTVAWTLFPDAQVGMLAAGLSDKGKSMTMDVDSEAWAGGEMAGHHAITFFSGESQGPAEIWAQSGSGDDRTKLLLQIG